MFLGVGDVVGFGFGQGCAWFRGGEAAFAVEGREDFVGALVGFVDAPGFPEQRTVVGVYLYSLRAQVLLEAGVAADLPGLVAAIPIDGCDLVAGAELVEDELGITAVDGEFAA